MEGPFSLYKDEADDSNALEFFSGKERRVKRNALYEIYMYQDQKEVVKIINCKLHLLQLTTTLMVLDADYPTLP